MTYEDFCESTDVSNHQLQFYLDGMNEENGEINGVLKRVRRGDYGELPKNYIKEEGLEYIIENYRDIKMDILKEIGDRQWYSTRFLQKINSSWKEVEIINVDKLKERIKSDKILGRGEDVNDR